MKRAICFLLFMISIFSLSAQEVDSIIDIRDGQVYKIVKIGKQWWMQENLRAINFLNGTPILKVESESSWGSLSYIDKAYCYFDNDSVTYAEDYGVLYTWAAVMNNEISSDTNPSYVQGVCPVGWHLPSDSEWKELEIYLGMSQAESDGESHRGTDEGGKLKEVDTTHWASPNTGATNESGFTALPGSYRWWIGHYGQIGTDACFWSSTENTYNEGWSRWLDFDTPKVLRGFHNKSSGFSVRCLIDSAQFNYLTILDKNLRTISKINFTIDKVIDTIIVIKTNAAKSINVSNIYTNTSAYSVNRSSAMFDPGDSIHLIISLDVCERSNNYFDTLYIENDNPYNPLIKIPLESYIEHFVEQLCYITTNLQTGNNLIVWEKTPDKGIAFYNIYREDELIGTVGYKNLTIFEDKVADPEKRSYLYRLSVVDTCGNESAMSAYHKPFFLQITRSEGAVNLSWDKYEIEGDEIKIDYYDIYRGSSLYTLTALEENIPKEITSYTDKDPIVSEMNYYYRVYGNFNKPCIPTGSSSSSISINSSYSERICPESNDGYIEIFPEGGIPPYKYFWSTGDTTSVISDLEEGDYILKVFDSKGLCNTDMITIGPKVPYPFENICIVTIDLTSGKNLIVWEKTPDVGTVEYNIYREITIGYYSLIGSNAVADRSVFLDHTGDPESQSYLYKITSVDDCGNESDIDDSYFHKPSFLQYVSAEGGINLEWTDYIVQGSNNIGDYLSSYVIYRGTESLGLSEYQTVGSITNFTDTDPNALERRYYYRVAGVLKNACNPTTNRKYDSSPYSHSFSNIENNRLDTTSAIAKLRLNLINIYPNPFNSSTTLQFTNPEGHPYSLYIMDLTGKVCRIIDNITTSEYVLEKGDLKEGFYFVELRGAKIYRGKIVIE